MLRIFNLHYAIPSFSLIGHLEVLIMGSLRSDLVSLRDWGKAQVHSQQVRFFVFVFFFYFDEKSSVFFILVLQQIDTL